ncbi:MAG: hypothetical protein U1F43_28970 [Myxococcota bacterium]
MRSRRTIATACLSLALAGGLGSARAAPPPNASCATAEALTLPARVAGTTLGVDAAQAPTPCSVEDRYAVWYSFEAPAEDRYTFALVGGELADTTLALYAACDDATPIACSDDLAYDLRSRIDLYLEAGQVVRVRVAGWGGTRGDFVLRADRFDEVERPPNDACEAAVPVAQDAPAAAATWLATGTDLSSCGPEDAVDIWYSFVAPSAGDYDFSITQNMVRAHYIAVFDGCGGAELGCGFLGAHATLAAGQMVALRVGTNPSAADWFDVGVSPKPPAVVPPNDTPQGALPLTVPSTVVATTRGATIDEGIDWGPDCGPHINAAIWYSFEAPADDVYVFDSSGSELGDTVVALFEDCEAGGAGPPALIVCNDFDGQGDHGRVDGFIEAGTRLCVAVAGRFLSEEGGVTLKVSTLGAPPVNDQCADALPIEVGAAVFGENYASVPVDITSACPGGNFALWYAFTAPADGLYKLDTKAGRDSWPDLAVYADCAAAEPVACSVEAQPAVSLHLARGQSVRVRVSTDVWWRGTLPLRVSAAYDDAPVPPDEGGAAVGAEGGAGVVDERGAAVVDEGGAEVVDEGGAEVGTMDNQGCGCGAAGAGPVDGALALAVLMLLRARARPRSAQSAPTRASGTKR